MSWFDWVCFALVAIQIAFIIFLCIWEIKTR